MQHVSLLKTSQSEVSVKGRRLGSRLVQALSERLEITFQPSMHRQKSHRPERSKLVAFVKLHRACEIRLTCSLILADVCCKLLKQLALSLCWELTCIKCVDNLQQTCCHQAGASDANTSWYRLDDCQVTSLQQTSFNLYVFGCVQPATTVTALVTRALSSSKTRTLLFQDILWQQFFVRHHFRLDFHSSERGL